MLSMFSQTIWKTDDNKNSVGANQSLDCNIVQSHFRWQHLVTDIMNQSMSSSERRGLFCTVQVFMHTEIPVRVLSIFTVILSLCKSKDRGNVLDQYDLEIVKSRIKSINCACGHGCSCQTGRQSRNIYCTLLYQPLLKVTWSVNLYYGFIWLQQFPSSLLWIV